MRAFLAVSLAPDAVGPLRRPVPRALSCLGDDDTVVERVETMDDGWAAFAGIDDADLLGDPGEPFTLPLSRLRRTQDKDLSTYDLEAMMADSSQLATLLPPFAAAHRSWPGGPVTVATDWLGYRQIYWWRDAGAAAVSTSARALAVLAGKGFDQAGLGAQAMVGWQVGDRTLFEGVRVLPPATMATLAAGNLSLRRYAEPLTQRGPAPALDDAVEEMAQILVTWQSKYLEAHLDAVLQLTGGHDSRILLGAIPTEQRRGLHALTLGGINHPDVVIAGQLAGRYGIQHHAYDLADHAPANAAQAHALSMSAARALECQASPMALAPLLLVEDRLKQGHRLSGLGGEVARGFYYAGQPAGAQTSSRLVEKLSNWRIFANEAVEVAALDSTFVAEAHERTVTTLAGVFEPGEWLRATDAFYLYQRMHRWGGAHGTVAAVRRQAVNPMLDRRFIELALAVAPADKSDSLLLGRLMSRLDPELAMIPLDSGLVPARLGTRDIATRLAIASVTARRAASKVGQKLARGRRPQLGAPEVARLVLAHWRADPSACRALYDLSMLDRRWLESLVAGDHSAAPTTVAFLVNLLAAVEEPTVSAH
jgi:asparagine synthase (glutamine-hydrolysing)